ncbi:hypothetical protein B9Z19DRAFT_1125534 [Tuber borchii]|uniref:Uncharacterized protein n=1 Tax=Tuber borchii TaxID=42251 RepID=A0A2T6ZUT6_TUBBO|nr:hypothetical protein B9Z19DRAFT_1125534 [Tuber borchii]
MSLPPGKFITGEGEPMDTSGGDPPGPLNHLTEILGTSAALVYSIDSNTDLPACSDMAPKRTPSPFPKGHGLGPRMAGSGKRQASPQLISTNQVYLADPTETTQGLVGEIDDLRQEADEGKQLSKEQIIAFERLIVTVEQATSQRQQELVEITQALKNATDRQGPHEEKQQRFQQLHNLTKLPLQPAPQVPAAPYACPPDRIESWIRERQGQEWRNKGKQPADNLFNTGDDGNGGQGPPKPPPKNNLDLSDHGSEDGHGGGGGRGGGGGGGPS